MKRSTWTSALFGLSAAVGLSTAGPLAAGGLQSLGEPEGFVDIVAWPGYIERGEIRPLVAKTFPLEEIAEAQREFLAKTHVGNFVLIPPPLAP